MFWVDFRDASQLNWFMNKGMKLCKWKSRNWITNMYGTVTHIGVKPIGLRGIFGYLEGLSHLPRQ